jgi:hypothetical protein
MNHLEDPLQEAYPVKLTRDRFVEVRIPTGADLLAVMSTKEDQVTAERNTAMLDRVITRYSHPGTSARKMNIKDRRTVLQFLYDVQPGPRIGEVKTPCLSCESEFLLGLNMAWLLQIQ